LKEVRKEEIDFTKEVAKESGLDMDDDELYAVGNMIYEIKLEREIEEKDKLLKGKVQALEEKDEIIKPLKEQIKNK